MTFTILRNPKKKGYVYTCSGAPDLHAEANYTLGLVPQTLSISGNTEPPISLVQKNSLLKLINALPIINANTFAPFTLTAGGKPAGRTRTRLFSAAFWLEFGSDQYELRLHSRNYCSLMKNDIQIALMQKDPTTLVGQRRYSVCCSEDLTRDLMLLCCAFADVTFFRNRGSAAAFRKETTVTIGRDKYSERIKWRPV